MDISTTNALLSGLMGFFGGLVTIPIHAIFAFWLKRDELKYAHKLDLIAKQRELILQHKLEMERKAKDPDIVELKSRLDKLEKGIKHG